MHSSIVEAKIKKANIRLRLYCGPNFKFLYNPLERRFELWEKRGPLTQMVIPLTAAGRALPDITDWEFQTAKRFVARRRKDGDREFYKYKEYKKWTAPKEYVDWRPKDDPTKWRQN